MARNLFKAQKGAIRAFKRAGIYDILGDSAASQSQLDAIYRNLGTAGAGLTRSLTSRQQREMTAMERIRGRNVRAGAREVRGTQREITSKYGAALGTTAATALRPAAAVASATKVGTLGQRRAATIESESGKAAMKVSTAAAAEAQSAADYAHEVALRSRYQENAQAVAQMQFELQQSKLNHQFAMEEMRTQAALQWKYRELELDKLQGAEEDNPAQYAGLTLAASSASSAFTGLQSIFSEKMDNGKFPNAAEAASAYLATHPANSPEEAAFVSSIANAMYSNGAGPENPGGLAGTTNGLYGAGTSPELRQQMTIDAIMETLLSLYPSYRDRESEIRSYLESTGEASFTLSAAGLLEQATSGGSGAAGPGVTFNPVTGKFE